MERDYKGVVFDFDGVICQLEACNGKAWTEALKANHIPFREESILKCESMKIEDALGYLVRETGVMISENKRDALLSSWKTAYRDLMASTENASTPKNTQNTIRRLSEMGYSLAVVSPYGNTDEMLAKFGIRDYFKVVIADTNPGDRSYLFKEATERMYVEKDECLLVLSDIDRLESVSNAGFSTAGIMNAAKSSKADYMLFDISDLLLFL